jgi:uncharacterized surface protein with fasciclin (FAS1) repeats
MKKVIVLSALFFTVALTGKLFAQTQPADGSTLLSSVSDDSPYYKMAAMIREANLSAALSAPGGFTLFAPSNALFRNLPPGKLDSLEKDPGFLKGYIVKGKYTQKDIIKLLTVGKGKAKLATVDGRPLKLTLTAQSKLIVTDANGDTAQLIAFDQVEKNGVIDGINAVLTK